MKKIGKGFNRFLALLLAVILLVPFNQFPAVAAAVDNTLVPGTYMGQAKGYEDGLITVTLTLEEQDGNVKITEIQAEGEDQTPKYWTRALTVLDAIKEKNGTDGVDTVSGATISSQGILSAADAALSKAAGENVFDSGTGSKKDPYLIANAETMQKFSASVAAGHSYAGKYISLKNNIDLAGIDWVPIGDSKHLFAGVFNGKGCTISNLTMGSEEAPSEQAAAGLFGYVTVSAQLLNVNLTGVNINIQTSSAPAYAGALAAFAKVDTASAQGTVFQNCHAEGAISVNTNGTAIMMVGGLVGYANQRMTMASCGTDVNIKAAAGEKNANIGGLIGFESVGGLLINCYSLGDVQVISGNANSNIGGLTGGANGMLYNNYTSSVVSAPEAAVKTGALVGSAASASILSRCYYTQDKTSQAIGEMKGIQGTEGSCAKSASEIASENFAVLLASHLTDTAKRAFQKEIEENRSVLSGCSYDARAEVVNDQYYNWICTNNKVTHDNELWANAEISDQIFSRGSGTEEDPYIISSSEQLKAFAKSLTAKLDYTGVFIKLDQDIQLTEERWIPIGEGEYAFNGSFDGDGHSIKGLTIGTKENPYEDPTGEKAGVYFGLFGVLESKAEVKNLTLVDVEMNVTSAQTIYVSGLAGYANGSVIDQVVVSGSIQGATTHKSANIFVGGIVGSSVRQKIINCMTSADVRSEAVGGLAEAGGIIGLLNRGLIANSYTTGTITGTADRIAEGAPSLGGIAAVNAGTILNCYSLSPISADCYTGYVGALVGWATGIADTFQSYYCTSTEIVTDSKTDAKTVISPAVAVGWSVGPGINDEGEPYTGSVALNVEGMDAASVKSETLVKRLNDNIGCLNADLAKGGRQSGHWTGNDAFSKALKCWTLENNQVVLGSTTKQAVYDPSTDAAIKALMPEETPDYYEGTFYGRNDQKNTIVSVKIGTESKITAIELLEGNGNYETVIADLIAGRISVKDLEDSDFKSALEKAFSKAAVNDTTTYGNASDALFASGDGTAENPWIIQTEDQLFDFAKSVNEDEDYSGKYVKLAGNISLTKEWIPVGGTNPWPFAGTFDGAGYEISNLHVGSETSPYRGNFAGMFAYVKGGTIKQITLKEAAVFIRNTGKDRIYAGALIAAADSKKSNGEIDQVSVYGKISAHSNSGATYAGGIIGQCSGGILTNSYANVEVNAKSDSAWVYAGAVEGIGAWNGVINNYAKGSVKAKAPVNKAAIGGITGFHSGALYNCWTSVDLIAESSTGDVGGVAGRNTGIGFILKCYYDADAKQMSGNLPAEEKKAVGTIVNGDDQGKGTAEELKALEDINSAIFAEQLNQNLVDTEAIDRVKELLHLENWGAGKADTMKFLNWAVSSKGSVRLISEKELAEVEDVIEKIDAIGKVTLESKHDIETARGAYEELSEDQKVLVTNYTKLESAEAEYAQLKAEADKESEKQDPSPSQKDDSGKDNSNSSQKDENGKDNSNSSQKDDNGKDNGNTSQKDDSGNLNHSSGNVETGDSNIVYVWILLLAAAAISSGVICRMRKLKK